jgi:hypothetical protein
VVKKVKVLRGSEGQEISKAPVQSPGLECFEDVENDLRVSKMKRLRVKTNNVEEWASDVKVDHVRRGP